MLSKNRRVSRRLFEEVFSKTKIFSTDFFTTRFFKVDGRCDTRFSVVVSKKVSLKAVRRNLIKRRITGILKIIENKIEDSYVVLIFCKKNVLEAPFSNLQKELKMALEHIKVLKSS